MAYRTHVPYEAGQRCPSTCYSWAAFYHHPAGKCQGWDRLPLSLHRLMDWRRHCWSASKKVKLLEGIWDTDPLLHPSRYQKPCGRLEAAHFVLYSQAHVSEHGRCSRGEGGDFTQGWAYVVFLPASLSQLSEGNVLMTVYRASSLVSALRLHQVKVNDGDWHHLQLELHNSRDSPEAQCLAIMAFDYGIHQVWWGPGLCQS